MKTYALIGASVRAAYAYAKPLVDVFPDCAKITSVFDVNPYRIDALKRYAGLDCPAYTDFDAMVTETKPDAAVITTVDRFHHEYIVRCLESGIDAITEKPMTIDAEKCDQILRTERRTGRNVTVAFNCRFMPYVSQIKQVIADGAIGETINVDFEYLLDTSHGADYFRRWHRKKENSGGLLVHKSTHHFDFITWWLGEEPVNVMAYGARRFYGPTRTQRGERCSTCSFAKTCEFYLDLGASEVNRCFYKDCESADGYYRDRCVFADDIDIEDTLSVNVKYDRGAVLSYSLVAHSPYEGWKACINGSDGRIEASEFYSGMRTDEPANYIDVYDRKGRKITYTVPKATGGHAGADEPLLQMIFQGGKPDPLGCQAGSFAGAVSTLIGVAANKSIADGRNVRIRDLVNLDAYR